MIKAKVYIHKNTIIINYPNNNVTSEKCTKNGGEFKIFLGFITRRSINGNDWRYQRDIQNQSIEDGRRMQWQKEKRKRTHNDIAQKTRERATVTLHKTRGGLWWSAGVSSSCSICGTYCSTHATNPAIVMNNKHNLFVVICNTAIP